MCHTTALMMIHDDDLCLCHCLQFLSLFPFLSLHILYGPFALSFFTGKSQHVWGGKGMWCVGVSKHNAYLPSTSPCLPAGLLFRQPISFYYLLQLVFGPRQASRPGQDRPGYGFVCLLCSAFMTLLCAFFNETSVICCRWPTTTAATIIAKHFQSGIYDKLWPKVKVINQRGMFYLPLVAICTLNA